MHQPVRKYILSVLLILMLSACGANRQLPTVAVLPTDPPKPVTQPAITVVATLAVAEGRPTLPPTTLPTPQSPTSSPTPDITATFTPLFEASVTLPPIVIATEDSSSAVIQGEREVTTCERIAELFSSLRVSDKGDFPADFPKPPDGSVACGTDGPGSVHFSSILEPDAIATHYREQLKAWGCSTVQDETFKPDLITLRFECPKGIVHVATNPDITEFIVRYVAN